MAQALAIGGGLLKAGGTIFASRAQAKALNGQADQLDAIAGQTRASSQRDAIEQRRQADLVQSRGLAVAAASGGGADDPTVVNLLSGIAGQGEYNALTSLYNGDQQARASEADAAARRKEAKNVKMAGYIGAASSLLGAGSSLYSKYGQ